MVSSSRLSKYKKYDKIRQAYSIFQILSELHQNIQNSANQLFKINFNRIIKTLWICLIVQLNVIQMSSQCWQTLIHDVLHQPQKQTSSSLANKGYRYLKFLQDLHTVAWTIIYIKQAINKSRPRFRGLQQQRTLGMFDLGHSNYLVQTISAKDIENSQFQKENRSFNRQLYQNSELLAYGEEVQDQKNDGKWSLREIMRYYQFLLQFRPLFKSKQLRKTSKIFSLMAKHIRSRQTSQCKSHHQKIQKYYGKIDEIIIHFSKILTPLKKEWQQFAKTQNRVLINAFPEINKAQENYQIFEFKDCIRIYIKEQSVQRYEI